MKIAIMMVLLLIFVPFPSEAASLRGFLEKAELQNQWADRAGVKPIRSEKELADLKRSGQLVPFPVGPGVVTDGRIMPELRFCRPEVRAFLVSLGRVFNAVFVDAFCVTSAVRTVTYQEALRKRNLNAAPTTGPEASSHLRGTTIDITKVGLTGEQVRWLRKRLGAMASKGQVIVVEEFGQSVFHVMVRPIRSQAKKER